VGDGAGQCSVSSWDGSQRDCQNQVFSENINSAGIYISYDTDGVNVESELEDEMGDLGTLKSFSPEQAREIAVNLYQAAEELERRKR
jgi:hypothetical protein